jgi:hypothetical protein
MSVVHLRHNTAGQAVITELLSQQAQRKERSALAQLLGLSPLDDDSRPWYWGALGEIAVGDVLKRLGAEWHALHAIPVGKRDSDIDHLVVGPTGVFTINTKNHSGKSVWVAGRTFMVSGQRKPWIRNAEHEAARASRLLSGAVGLPVPVRPLIVVHDPKGLTVKEKPAEVVVLTTRTVRRWLTKQRSQLLPEVVARILDAAANPALWRPGPAPVLDRSATMESFQSLDREVRSAMRVRLLWSTAMPLVVAAISLRVFFGLG